MAEDRGLKLRVSWRYTPQEWRDDTLGGAYYRTGDDERRKGVVQQYVVMSGVCHAVVHGGGGELFTLPIDELRVEVEE